MLLSRFGFTTTFSHLRKGLNDANQRSLDDEDSLAKKGFMLVVKLLRFRLGSQYWHRTWPGLLALFLSTDESDWNNGLDLLTSDIEAYMIAKLYEKADTVIAKVVKRSPFRGKVMSDISDLVRDSTRGRHEIIGQLKALAEKVYAGFGQTKVVEDALHELRRHESEDVTNKVFQQVRQYSTLRDDGVLEKHRRTQVSPPTDDVSGVITGDTFRVVGQKPTIDAREITNTAYWPTMNAQASQVLCPERELLLHCAAKDCFEDLSACWHSVFVPAGCILRNIETGKEYISLGHVLFVGLLVWEAYSVVSDNGTIAYSFQNDGDVPSQFLMILDFAEWQIVPTKVVSPARHFVERGCKFAKGMGICLIASGPRQSVLFFSAKNCFFDVSREMLTKLAKERGVQDKTDLFDLCCALIADICTGISQNEIDEILAMRGVTAKPLIPADLEEEAVQALLSEEDAKEFKDLKGSPPLLMFSF